ncbi:bifunctional tetrahydrofolate synthase/dihydrofolate synthase [Salinimonas sp. HHU 13199]|uniref:Dihydrofolate synthase/folylpolyglutamate synthase n=1 Tax=Salinimonas profundi TaxID=2729140 RepID=A0ABR8LIL9_9ALTE|nr:bifunctional tetrahydrofolate synthase/dihydrofolate synthase [Salinimonas profundi]MBD3584157.1 bifunctional tetrahydrofolate synthase/dihydrofolate synthase [Salinimonas profundi]
MKSSTSAKPQNKTLTEWLSYLESIHPSVIELGLNRIKLVADRLNLDFSDKTVITVAGTNGKGTTCRFLEQACLSKGKTTGVYSSPHLLEYQERVRINNVSAQSQALCAAFATIEEAREDISLTYFEFGTLAALLLMKQADVDILILEVGLGGRLDATNIIDADLAVITTIDLDHQDWLGDTRDAIAREKAGIMRSNGKAVIGEPEPPQSLRDVVESLSVSARWAGQDFYTQQHDETWSWISDDCRIDDLPTPRIPIQNVATALAALQILDLLPAPSAVRELAAAVSLPGRLETIALLPRVVVDVGHNPQAMAALRRWIASQPYHKLHFVAGMLKDKSIKATLAELNGLSARWFLGTTKGPRGAASRLLQENLDKSEQNQSNCYNSVGEAYAQAINEADERDLIIVFGSFLTVADVMHSTLPPS